MQKSSTEVRDFCLHLFCQCKLKSAGDFDTNAHPCRIGGADFLLYETTQQGGCKPIQDSELLEAFEPYIAAFLGK